MPRFLRILLVWVAVLTAGSTGTVEAQFHKKEDVIHMKDGRVIRGAIVEYDTNSETILVRLHDGTFQRLNKADISMMTKERPLLTGVSPKNPTLSWGLSFLFPGTGQIYNGDVAKGIGLAIFGASGVTVFLSANGCSFDDECNQRRRFGGALFLLAWIGSQVEAPIKASRINRDLSRVSLGLGPQPHALGLSLANLRF